MKKITACFLVLSMILNLASCSTSGSQAAAPTTTPDSATQAAAPTDSEVSDQSALAQAAGLFAPPNEDYSTMGTLAEESPVIDGIYTAPVLFKAEEGKYYLNDQKRRFIVGNYNGKSSDDAEKNFKPVYSSGNSIFGDTKEEVDQELYKGFYLTTEIGKIRDYFYNNFGVDTQGHTLFIGYNDGYEGGKSAIGGVGKDKTYSTIYIGKNVSLPCRGILAHEYTHTIQYMHHFVRDADDKGSSLKMDEETVTISEGLADVFACFYTGEWVIDFTPLGNGEAYRNAENPSGHHKSNIQDKVKSSEKEYGYNYATCISHAAYLMSESGDFGNEKVLQSVWFDAMVSLPAHCKYTDLRECMEKAAIRAKLTGKQKLAIANAFDAVGISHFDKAEKFNNNIELVVHDLEDQVYDDYKVEIYKLNKDSRDKEKTYNYSTVFAESHTQNKREPLQLHLDDGTYRILISDNSPSKKIEARTIVIDSSSENNLINVSDFGASYTVAPGAKLTVLDADGNVLKDYKATASGNGGYSKQITGILNLPEKNYYTVNLSHMEEGSAVMNWFTVRIQKDADDEMTFKSTFKGDSAGSQDSSTPPDSQKKSEDSSTPPDSREEQDEGGTASADTNTNNNQSDSQSPESLYAGVVRDYESKYGKLTLKNVYGSVYYTGVFLIKLIDFDKDGIDELLIGYSTKLEGYPEYITVPKLDVWSIENSNTVRSYEGAIVHHGDIGSHCAYIDMDGQYFLINGYSGYDTDLHLMELHNGNFQDYYTLVNDGNGSCKINDEDVDESEWVEMYQKIDEDAIKYHGVITNSEKETEDSLRKDLEQAYTTLGM